MKTKWMFGVLLASRLMVQGQNLIIESFDTSGIVTFNSVTGATGYRVEWAAQIDGPWTNSWDYLNGIPQANSGIITAAVPMFYRVVKITNFLDYLVVDLTAGSTASNYPVSTLYTVPPGGWTDEYKMSKLVLRRIPAGTFTMGSPTGEIGRLGEEVLHQVTISQPFYMGVFEVTQKQWELVTGEYSSYHTNIAYRDSRPAEQVAYRSIRGTTLGTNWPANSNVDADSFMGRLRARTGKAFDLPTESQWEYAGRAKTVTSLNTGFNLTNSNSDVHLNSAGRYLNNGGFSLNPNSDVSMGTAKVGSYLPNELGLYDIHGNVHEWCLDWYGPYPGTATNPAGAISGSTRIVRGGGWGNIAKECRSASRLDNVPNSNNNLIGFRAALPAD